jgi:hypothetical protein
MLANTKYTTQSKTHNIIQWNLTETCLFSMRKSMSSAIMAGRLVGWDVNKDVCSSSSGDNGSTELASCRQSGHQYSPLSTGTKYFHLQLVLFENYDHVTTNLHNVVTLHAITQTLKHKYFICTFKYLHGLWYYTKVAEKNTNVQDTQILDMDKQNNLINSVQKYTFNIIQNTG